MRLEWLRKCLSFPSGGDNRDSLRKQVGAVFPLCSLHLTCSCAHPSSYRTGTHHCPIPEEIVLSLLCQTGLGLLCEHLPLCCLTQSVLPVCFLSCTSGSKNVPLLLSTLSLVSCSTISRLPLSPPAFLDQPLSSPTDTHCISINLCFSAVTSRDVSRDSNKQRRGAILQWLIRKQLVTALLWQEQTAGVCLLWVGS